MAELALHGAGIVGLLDEVHPPGVAGREPAGGVFFCDVAAGRKRAGLLGWKSASSPRSRSM